MPSSVEFAVPDLSHVRGLADFWARATGRAVGFAEPAVEDRILLDMLGLGLEQTFAALRGRPDLAAFEQWVLETVGAPDPLALARYHAACDEVPPPPAIRSALAAIDALPPVLGVAELAQWEADGYTILRGAISPGEATAAADFLWHSLDARPDDPASWYAPRTHGIMVQLFQHPCLEPARRSPRVHKAFAQLWGTADLWSAVDRMSFNPPALPDKPFPGPHLHWDVSLAQPIPFGTQGILYLTDTAADQGALQLVPGFHHRIDAWLDSLGGADPRQVDLSDQAITIPAGAGDLVLWRQDLPHGASRNAATRPRLAQYVNMRPARVESRTVWR